jgi:hypothetical protein
MACIFSDLDLISEDELELGRRKEETGRRKGERKREWKRRSIP